MGKVYLVGAGPGAPDLLTLRAARLLAEADIVLYDALVHPDTLALAERAEWVDVGKRVGCHSAEQRFINKRLVDAARKHNVVVRLKGGDPMLFGRAQEEIDALNKAGIAFEVVPGITAALAASAELKVPLTERGVARSVTFATMRIGKDENDEVKPSTSGDTLVLYMASREADATRDTLIANGWRGTTPVAVIENASLPNQRIFTTTLGDLSNHSLPALTGPALLCVGQVFRHAARMHAASSLSRGYARSLRSAIGR